MNIELNELLDEADRAYHRLTEVTEAAYVAADALAWQKYRLESARAERLAAGIEAKNEAMREAMLRTVLTDRYSRLADREEEVRSTRYVVELAQFEVDRVRLRVRLMELAAGQGSAR